MIKKNYKLPPSYSLGNHGNACFLEPPGHPRYFTQSIYTQHGNSPSRGSQYFLADTGYEFLDEVDKLYKPLPYDHPRVKAWEEYLYKYFANCYSKNGANRNIDASIIYVPKPNHWTEVSPEKWTTTPQPPENHLAHLKVKETYPDAKPRLDLISNTPQKTSSWWERLEEKPTPDKCPGDEGISKHPVNGTWCQVCGWVQPQ